MRRLLASLLVIVPVAASAGYPYDGSTLPYPKTDKVPLPAGEDPTKNLQATDWNKYGAAIDGLRSAVEGGTRPTGATAGLAQAALGCINVKDKSAAGNGIADDTTPIANAIAAAVLIAPVGSGCVWFPQGTYKVTAPTVIIAAQGLHLIGAGERATVIYAAGAGMSGAPVFKFLRSRESSIRDMRITSDGSNVPSAGIEFRTQDPSGGAISTANLVERVFMDSLAIGVRMTAAGGQDSNNDLHTIRDCKFNNLTVAAVSLENAQSLWNRWIGGYVNEAPIGLKVTGGSATVSGVAFNVSDVVLDISGGFSVYHPITFVGGGAEPEVQGSTEGKLVRTDTTADLEVAFVGFEQNGGPTAVNYIDFQSATSTYPPRFTATGCRFILGQPNVTARFAAGTVAEFSGSTLSFDLAWGGSLKLTGNHHIGGTVTETPGAASTLVQIGDTGGQYSSSTVRGWLTGAKMLGGLAAGDTGVDVVVGSQTTRVAGSLFAVDNNGAPVWNVDYAGNLRSPGNGDLYVGQVRAQGDGNVRFAGPANSYTQVLGSTAHGSDYGVLLDNAFTLDAGKIVAAVRNNGGTREVANFTSSGRVNLHDPAATNGASIAIESVLILSGTGAPENNVAAPVGSLWLRTNGGAGTTLCVKESGTGNTGWVCK